MSVAVEPLVTRRRSFTSDVQTSKFSVMSEKLQPGVVRDAILESFTKPGPLTVEEIHASVEKSIGREVARSSVRSYLRLNTPKTFERLGRGSYRKKRVRT